MDEWCRALGSRQGIGRRRIGEADDGAGSRIGARVEGGEADDRRADLHSAGNGVQLLLRELPALVLRFAVAHVRLAWLVSVEVGAAGMAGRMKSNGHALPELYASL